MKTVSVLDTGDPQVKFVNTWSLVVPVHWRFSGIRSGFPPDFTDERQEGGGMIRIIDDTHFELIRYSLTRKGNFTGGWLFGLPKDLKGTAEEKALRQTALQRLGGHSRLGRLWCCRNRKERSPIAAGSIWRPRIAA